MTRARLAALALALAAAGTACTKTQAPAAGVRLRQPSAVAAFAGRTLQDEVNVKPYLAVANAARNDISLVDGVSNQAVLSPVKLQTLVLPVADRPMLLVSASLGDGRATPTSPPTRADLLVAVAGGDSVLQVVETWTAANVVHSEPPLAVDLGYEVIALAALPFEPDDAGNRVKIAAVLAGSAPGGTTVPGHIAIVEYQRAADGEAIQRSPLVVDVRDLPFEPLAIAAMPDDPDLSGLQTNLYVATLDPIDGVYGVAEIASDLSNAATPRGLGARAPTRLVAAARLKERFQPPPGASTDDLARSAASDATAFDGQSAVPRVYAVLDESGCGPSKQIDCGVVTLDPGAASGTEAIPRDYVNPLTATWTYRAPMRIAGRALALAVSPPAAIPPAADGSVDYSGGTVPASFMRVFMGSFARATTGVAAVASDNGYVYFLDLGRFETVTAGSPIGNARLTGKPTAELRTVTEGTATGTVRLWVRTREGAFPASDSVAADAIEAVPGFSQAESWTVTWQGKLPGLDSRPGEAGQYSPGQPWIAVQTGDRTGGGARFTGVAKLWSPELAVVESIPNPSLPDHPEYYIPGDILVIKAAGMPAACVGTRPPEVAPTKPDSEVQKEFEVVIDRLLPPDDARFPGGAVTVKPPGVKSSETAPAAPPGWLACYDALVSAAAGTNVLSGLTVSVRAQKLVMIGATAGYAGRPPMNAWYELAPPADEDVLRDACPLAVDPNATACDLACRTACEAYVVGRKIRRQLNLSVDCSTNPDTQADCEGLWPPPAGSPPFPAGTYPFPAVIGPALGIRVDVQRQSGTVTSSPVRDLALTESTSSAVAPFSRAVGSPTSPFGANGAVAFDRSIWTDPIAGYRFFVSYPADFVLDTTPSQNPAAANVIR